MTMDGFETSIVNKHAYSEREHGNMMWKWSLLCILQLCRVWSWNTCFKCIRQMNMFHPILCRPESLCREPSWEAAKTYFLLSLCLEPVWVRIHYLLHSYIIRRIILVNTFKSVYQKIIWGDVVFILVYEHWDFP